MSDGRPENSLETQLREMPVRIRRPVVATFGRFQPPTTGHARLIDCMRLEAVRHKAGLVVFPSPTEDAKQNPLPFMDKVRYMRLLFSVPISGNATVRTPLDAIRALSLMGFDAVYFVVGSDHAAEFTKFADYIRPSGLKSGQYIILKQYRVVVVPESRNAAANDVSGMTASKLRTAVVQGDWTTFRRGIPTTNDRVAAQLYELLRKRLQP